jgi:ribose/xylose/arabinose/galactoside ABC-type transport system permease subunit
MSRLYWHFRALLALVLAVIVTTVATGSVAGFSNPGNLYALLASFATLALVSAGLAVTMIAGEFDLSVAGTFPLAGLLAVWFSDEMGAVAGTCISIGVVLCIGLLNGWLVAQFGISSLAVTIGTMVLAIGLGFAVAQGGIVSMTDYAAGLWLEAPIAEMLSARSIILIIALVIIGLLIGITWFGRFLKSVGADRRRARELGTPVRTTLIFAFLISAFTSALAGSLQGIALASGSPGSAEAFLLSAVTGAIVGGVALSGGMGTIPGVAAGALLLTLISNSLSLAGTPAAVIELTNGLILLLVVVIDRPIQRLLTRAVGRVPASAPTSAEIQN